MYDYHHSSIYNRRKCPYIVQSCENCNKSISITHPTYFYFIITNNDPFILNEHLIWLPITERFLKLGLIALNMVNNNRALFIVISLIKKKSTPCPGLRQSLTLNGYSSGLT